ncbi:MAG TPA: hypothetical protein PLI89_11745, partial [Chitinophagales bacterium]|nr:hypothetical protein [Chitinophagales bacterium]
ATEKSSELQLLIQKLERNTSDVHYNVDKLEGQLMALEDKLAATLRPSQPKIEEDKPLDKKPEEVEPNTQVGHALKDRIVAVGSLTDRIQNIQARLRDLTERFEAY